MQKQPPQSKLVYTLDETAQLLNVSRQTLWKFTSSGDLRTARLGHRCIRVTQEALMDFLRARETKAAQR